MEMKLINLEVEILVNIGSVDVDIKRMEEVCVETTDMNLEDKKEVFCVETTIIVLKMKVVVPISKKVVRPKSKKAVNNMKTVPKKSITDSRAARDGRSTREQISDVELIEVVDTRRPILDIEEIMT